MGKKETYGNVPYMIKKDEKTGKVLNPIKKGDPYMSFDKNHRQRRWEQRHPHGERPTGLVVYKNGKDFAFWQHIPLKETVKVKDPENSRRKITVTKVTGYKRIYHKMPVDGFSVGKEQETE